MRAETGKLRILFVEDVARDADLATRELRRAGLACETRVVDSREAMLRELEQFAPDAILSDYTMPRFTGMQALEVRNQFAPDVPFIVVTATINEETAVECLQRGADDYVIKDRLMRLPSALRNAVEKKRLQREQRLAQETLRATKERLQFLVSSSPAVIYTIKPGPEQGVSFISPNVTSLLGYEPRDFTEAPDFWLHHVHPEDAPRVVARRTMLFEAGSDLVEYRFLHRDGTYRWMRDEVNLVRNPERGPEIIGYWVDVTEAKEAEEALAASERRYRALFEGAAEGILVADAETHAFLYANPAICRMLGYAAEELLQLGVESIHPQASLPRVLATFAAQAREELTLATCLPCQRKDGSVLLADINTARMEMDGRTCLVGFFTDVTEQMRLEAEKDQLEAQLRQAQKLEAVGRLAGGVAHDFNNMLSVIHGYGELALDKVAVSSPLHGDIEQILNAAARSRDITRQLLTFARQQVISPKTLDLNEAIEGTLKMLGRLVGEDIELDWRPRPELWPVRMDPSQLDQILANLCVNARDAIAGVGRVRIHTENVVLDEEGCAGRVELVPGEYVMLAVRDNGMGMDGKTLDRIFEPFFTTKGPGKGTGLGLSTVYGIVKQNQACIQVESEPGSGTMFRIYLPRHAADGIAAEPVEKTLSEVCRGQGQVVLVVEDEPSILRLVARILHRIGYTVLAADGPGKALDLARDRRDGIQLLVTDVVMPEMNGKELADRLRVFCPDMKCLFMSGYTPDAVAERGALEEVGLLLQKPFSMGQLAAKIRTVLGGR